MQANKALLLSNMLSSTNSVENADIASFEASCVTPLDITVDIDPVQDLHGYDNPWPGGGGKNLLNLNTNVTVVTGSVPSAVTITSGDGTATITETYYNRDTNKFGWEFKTEENQEYAISGLLQSTASVAIKVYSADGGLVTSYNQSANSQINHTFNSGSNTTLYFYASISSWGQTITLSNVQIEKGSTVTSYAPYSNVCPISGWDRAKVTRTGRNLYARENGEYNVPVFDTNGVPARYPDVNAVWIKVLPNTTYTVSNIGPISQMYYVRWINCDKNKKFISRPGGTYTNESLPVTFTTPSNCEWVEIAINQYDTNHISKNDWIVQVEEGSTAHAYEPYTAVTHEIPFSTKVYGGKLNVETGECVVTHTFDDLGTLNWKKSSSKEGGFYATPSKQYPGNSSNIMLCDGYGFDGARSTPSYFPDNGKFTYFPSSSVREVYFRNTSFSSAADFKASVNGMKIVYPLATPITLTLDPVEINSLIGENNVWSDTGNVSVRNITCNADVLELLLKTKLIGDC